MVSANRGIAMQARRSTTTEKRQGARLSSGRQNQRDTIMKIAFSPASPYVRKCTAAAIARGIDSQIERWKVGTTDPALLEFNPLSKVPTFITGDGMVLYDS